MKVIYQIHHLRCYNYNVKPGKLRYVSQCYTINILILSLIRYVCSYFRNIFLENMFVTRTKNYCLELQNTKNEFILFDDVSFCHVFFF